MPQRIDLAKMKKPVRDFFMHGLGPLREPVELVFGETPVAKIVPPTEFSEAEKQRILDEGWSVVEKARARTKGIPASVIQKSVDAAVREVRARHDQRQ